jgi:glycosyltransferase involved in cell wall biosynthesis
MLGSTVPQRHVAMRNMYDVLSRWRISQIVREYRPHIVQTYMGRATRLTHVPPGRGTVHVARLGGFYKLKGYRHAHAWVGNTRAICDYLRDGGLEEERVFHIPNFLEAVPDPAPEQVAELRRRYGLSGSAPVVMAAGRFVEKKGFDDLLRAFARLPALVSGQAPCLFILGDGPQRDALERLAAELGLLDRVYFTGWQDDPAPYYALATVFVCPSRHEPLGNVILEAWAHGLPVISTQTHGARELVSDGENGLLVPCRDDLAMAEALEEVLCDPEPYQGTLGESGRRRVETEYARERVVDAYLELYGQLIEEGKSGK